MKKSISFVGVYDYTVILTLLSLASAVVGMIMAMQDQFRSAILLLAICGLLDTFDGKVARTKKDRTEVEKLYGIQLDSLVDVVSFGVFPALLCYLMGMRSLFDIVILVLYVICGVTRLAYFNVLETNRQLDPDPEEKVFHGLPITSVSVILPLTFLCTFIFQRVDFVLLMRVVTVITGFLFVLDFRMKKPENKHIIALIVIVGLATAAILLFSRYKLPKNMEPEKPLIEMEVIQSFPAGEA